ncbi:GNAT family N-acetyltransferase [Candidatus Woesearchaeota archaeon]|nr:GNAT family N-acetyltransferase [Candidatus Woesearchaeota archaeon]
MRILNLLENTEIRYAREEDFSELEDLTERTLTPLSKDIMKSYREYLGDTNNPFKVAEYNSQIIGYAFATENGTLEYIAVDKEFQQSHLGSYLLYNLLSGIEKLGITEVELTSKDYESDKFYKKNGFFTNSSGSFTGKIKTVKSILEKKIIMELTGSQIEDEIEDVLSDSCCIDDELDESCAQEGIYKRLENFTKMIKEYYGDDTEFNEY